MEEILGRFGRDPQTARAKYQAFLADGLADPCLLDFYRPKGNRYLGHGAFIQQIKRQAQEPVRQKERRLKPMASLEVLMRDFQELTGVRLEAVCSPSQVRKVSRARKVLVYVARCLYRFHAKELAQVLKRDPTAISQITRQAAEIATWEMTRQALAALEQPDRATHLSSFMAGT